jgi:putative tricarboxylic transport membrane protein
VTAPPAEGAPAAVRPQGRRPRPTALTAFLGVLVLVLAVYTQLAMGMEWRTHAGRIGPGFFPRIVGILGLVLCCVAAVRSLSPVEPDGGPGSETGGETDGRPAGEPEHGRHPWMLAAASGGLAAFGVLLLPLGAILACALFMFGLSRLLGRGSVIRDLVLSLVVPLALYLLFEIGLNAGLPKGVLPLF